MLEPKIVHSLYTLGVKPAKYDASGWLALLAKTLSPAMLKEAADGPFPESLDDYKRLALEYKEAERAEIVKQVQLTAQKSDAESLASQTGMAVLDAQKFIGLDDDRKMEVFGKFVEAALKKVFPRCYPEMHPSIINYLSEHFMFTASGGKYVYYTRISDSPNIWEESPVAPPFENSSGEFRATLTALLAMSASNEYLQVMSESQKDGQPKLYRQIPKYKMFIKYRQEIMRYVTGPQEAVDIAGRYLDAYIEDSKRRANGGLTEYEIKKGIENKADMLHELDLSIPDITWCHRGEVNIANMTNDLTTPAYAYFDLESLTDGDTPDFDGFMTGIAPECRETFMAAVYATFVAKSKLSQYIWLHGEGGDGKSSFLSALAEYAGKRLACSLNAQAIKSDFGLEECVGKRIVIISDVKTGLTVKSGLIHNLTGHDPIWVNRKNKPAITVTFNPVLWIASNSAPDVDFSNPNESRRCIYIRVRKPSKEIQKRMYFLDEKGEIKLGKNGKPQFNGYDLQGKLVKEMPHILFKCKAAFEALCPAPHNAIQQSDEALDMALTNCIDMAADEMEYYIQQTFTFDEPDAKMRQVEVFNAIQETREDDGKRNSYNQFEKNALRRKLENAHGCQQKKINGIYYLQGIQLRPKELNYTMKGLKPVEVNNVMDNWRGML